MASVEFQVKNTSPEVKYDAFPYCDSLKVDRSDILKINDFDIVTSDTHSDSDHNADKQENFLTLLSDTREDNQVSLISPCEVDVSLSGLSKPRAFEKHWKPTDFLGFTCSSSTSKSMKFKDISECEGNGSLSDLLSPVTNNPSNHNDFPVFEYDVSLTDICVPKFHETETSSSSNVNKELSSDSSDFDLSDILSSLSVGESNQSKSSPLKNSTIKNCGPSLSFDDFKISNQINHIKEKSGKVNHENLSDIFSLLDGSNLSPTKLDHSLNKKPIPQTIKISEDVLDEGFSGNKSFEKIPAQDKTTFNNLNLDNSGNVNIMDDKIKGKEMLDNDEIFKHEYSSSEDSGVSMMDFLSSLEGSKGNTSTSEDDSDKYSSYSLSSGTPENLDEFKAVDLNFCIKTSLDKSSSTKDKCGTRQFKRKNPGSRVNPLPLQHSVDPVTSQKRMKQSLFYKSFAFEPKRNPSLIRKVANIKADILNQAFGCSTPVNFHCKAPLPNVASYTDNPIATYAGRRMFNSTGASVVC